MLTADQKKGYGRAGGLCVFKNKANLRWRAGGGHGPPYARGRQGIARNKANWRSS